jgi:hypothetical protein
MKQIQDERTVNETNKIAAKLYWLILVMSGVVGAIMFALDRTFIIFVPIIVAVGGSVIFFVARYAYAGILFSRATDERIEIFKINTKAYCLYICWAVYGISGAIVGIALPDNPAAILIFFIWIIPCFAAMVQFVRKGVGSTGFATNEKKPKRRGIFIVILASLFYGGFITWLNDGIYGLWPSIFHSLLTAVLWGVPFYFIMRFIDRRTEKNADKLLKNTEDGEEA